MSEVTNDELFDLATAAWESQTSSNWHTDAMEAVILAVRHRLEAANAAERSRQAYAERHPGPWIGPDAELARACAMAAIRDYGTDDLDTHQRIMKYGVWNDHVAVQAALAAIHNMRKAAPK